ncbi:Hypothetical Protein FCC1311_009722 [Hondaea fermentalgiana]|uniref:Uncharacterized protein n=1 Tax=Hondaea fermentalgiana TaxID=2315210 RepID=A0A2R5GAN3_9STRA|nr:Hypothetical Protein FCC1311_009722 [Hondaea fermentalgiana]|eukprot:GBG24754.1 Hypothetical Protein FCC1311_009722 [Hondaea fermentalgiana]
MDSDEDDLGRGAHERALLAALEPELGREEDEEGAGEGGAIAALRPVITEREDVDVEDVEEDDEDDDLEDDDFEDSPSLRGVGDLDAELAPGMRRRVPSSEDANSSLEQEMGDEATSDEEYFAGPRPRGNGRRQGSGRVHFDLDAEDAEYESPRQAAWEAQLGAWGHSLVMFSSIGIGLYVASKIVNIDFVRFLGMVFLGGLGMLAARPSYNPRLSTMIEHNLNEAELETIRTFVQRRVDLHDAPGAARDEYLGRLKRSSVGMGMHSMAGSSSRGSGLHSSAAASGYPSHYIRYSSGGLGPVPENEEDLYF